MIAHVETCVRGGTTAVLTLHASGESPQIGFERPWTVDAVRMFLDEAQRRGWHRVVHAT
jgi:hypothetical protein